MTEREYCEYIDGELEFPEGTFHRGVMLNTLPLWDSMQQLVFLAKTEESLGVVLEGARVGQAVTVDELLDMVRAQLGSS